MTPTSEPPIALPVPTVGRIVHFTLEKAGPSVSEIRPAVIVRVHPDGAVNIRIFDDGPNDNPSNDGTYTTWRGKVSQADGPVQGCWSWPPR